MDTPQVSVIIPVYNMEKTIVRCLDSILKQDYDNIEVVLINDGSRDNSAALCAEYAEKYRSIKYITRENKGVSLTYKEGVDISTSQFLMFVDSDDYIEPHTVSALVSAQQSVNADIVQCGINYLRVDGSLKGQTRSLDRLIEDKETLLHAYFIDTTINRTFAAALFRKALFSGVEFPERSLSIDIQVMPFVLKNCQAYRQINEHFYNAVQYPDSVSRGGFSEQMYKDKLSCSDILDGFFYQYAPQLYDYMYYRRCSISSILYGKIIKSKKPVLEKKTKVQKLKQMFAENYPLLVNSKYYHKFEKKERVKFYMFNINPGLYMVFMSLYGWWIELHKK